MQEFRNDINGRLKLKLEQYENDLEEYWTDYVAELIKHDLPTINPKTIILNKKIKDEVNDLRKLKQRLIEMIPKKRSDAIPEELKEYVSEVTQELWEADMNSYLEPEFRKFNVDELKIADINKKCCNVIYEKAEQYAEVFEEKKEIFINKIIQENGDLKKIVAIASEMYNENGKDNSLLHNIDCMIRQYIKEYGNWVHDMYEDKFEEVITKKITLLDVCMRTHKAKKLLNEEFNNFDVLFRGKCFQEFKIPSKYLPALVKEIEKGILTKKDVWRFFLSLDDCWFANVQGEFRREICGVLEGISTQEFAEAFYNKIGVNLGFISMKNTPDDVFVYNHKIHTFERCLRDVLCNCIGDIEYFGKLARSNTSYYERDFEKRRKKEIVDIARVEVVNIFNEEAGWREWNLEMNSAMVGMLYDVRLELEANIIKSKENRTRVEIKRVYDETNNDIYICDPNRIIVGKYHKEKSEDFDVPPTNIVFGYLNPIYQERLNYNEKLKAMLEGRLREVKFSAYFDKIQFLRQDLSEYESYIIEKQTGIFLAWTVYYRTYVYIGENDCYKEWIVEAVRMIRKIQNADIRVEVADKFFLLAKEYIVKNEDSEEILCALLEELEACIEEYNRNYDIVYRMLLLAFSKESSEGEVVNDRLQLLRIPYLKRGLGRVFRTIENEFQEFYNNAIPVDNPEYQSRLQKLYDASAKQKEYKWFKMILDYIK